MVVGRGEVCTLLNVRSGTDFNNTSTITVDLGVGEEKREEIGKEVLYIEKSRKGIELTRSDGVKF